MSRRDTIIIAVLINACLLVILFATSVTKHEPHFAVKQELPFSPQVQNLNFEDVERSLVKETKNLEESFPLHTPLTTQEEPIKLVIAESAPVVEMAVAPKKINSKESQFTEVTVKSGDYLERIGKENNVSVHDIMTYNNLKSTQLKIGQVLRIPLKEGESPKAKPSRKQYIVKAGDTAWKIANENHMQVDDLLKMNHLDKESSKHLKPGDVLVIK